MAAHHDPLFYLHTVVEYFHGVCDRSPSCYTISAYTLAVERVVAVLCRILSLVIMSHHEHNANVMVVHARVTSGMSGKLVLE